MGVRYLKNTLESFATRLPVKNFTIVVDGHALAYHIYYTCLSARPTSANAFEAQPDYYELAQFVCTWLENLRQSEVIIEKIFFDGFLPESKLKTRLSRLSSLSLQLQTYFKLNTTPCQSLVTHVKTNVPLFGAYTIPIKLLSCPPLPFLVPTIIEVLCRSRRYKKITEVVPWEADLYCANYINKNGGLVLTGDSDLLIHDLGPDGRVAFFKDIRKVSVNSELSILVYHPFAIQNNLGLDKHHGLRSLAFELRKCLTIRAPSNVIEQAKSLKAVSAFRSEYEDFIKEYSVKFSEISTTIDDHSLRILGSRLRTLDPRVSEYVLQFPSFTKAAQGSPTILPSNQDKHRIFLPFLLDSPIRTSAWEVCATVRLLAYGIVNLLIPEEEKVMSVWEYRRQQDKFGGRELQLPHLTQIPNICGMYCGIYRELKKKLSSLGNHRLWIALAIYQEVEWSRSQEKVSLSEWVTTIIGNFHSNSNTDKLYQWEVIHLISQVDASLYSFRILHQITGVLMAYGCKGSFSPALIDLYKILKTLPNLNDYYDRDSTARFFSTHLKLILTAVKDILPTSQEAVNDHNVSDKFLGIEKASQGKVKLRLTNNPFDVLKLEE
ncbi:putative dna replication initiation factor cdc45 [Erysiphe neolycopersici]|uniref:Putative dna replication initiation factor cdc45 n=1 Tax=Erysiphe neolycopersici TaxID=212602 RepID=A0A420I7U8_9PEZI|nr:putative dna replication initiation factor cdc45 [Erysiphe neolycopersici]